MKICKVLGIFSILLGIAITIYSAMAFSTLAFPAAGPALAAGIGTVLTGIVLLLIVFAQNNSSVIEPTYA